MVEEVHNANANCKYTKRFILFSSFHWYNNHSFSFRLIFQPFVSPHTVSKIIRLIIIMRWARCYWNNLQSCLESHHHIAQVLRSKSTAQSIHLIRGISLFNVMHNAKSGVLLTPMPSDWYEKKKLIHEARLCDSLPMHQIILLAFIVMTTKQCNIFLTTNILQHRITHLIWKKKLFPDLSPFRTNTQIIPLLLLILLPPFGFDCTNIKRCQEIVGRMLKWTCCGFKCNNLQWIRLKVIANSNSRRSD